jgi:hypothetical protein
MATTYLNTTENEARYQAIRLKYAGALQERDNLITNARRKLNVAKAVRDYALQQLEEFNAVPRTRWTQEEKDEKTRLQNAFNAARHKLEDAEKAYSVAQAGEDNINMVVDIITRDRTSQPAPKTIDDDLDEAANIIANEIVKKHEHKRIGIEYNGH